MLTPEQLAACGSESGHQKALFCWIAQQSNSLLQKAFAIGNGGKRDKITGARMKAEGVKRGVPDIFLPVARGPFHGLFIEMKTATGDLSREQKNCIASLRNEGYRVQVCRSWSEASLVMVNYLEL